MTMTYINITLEINTKRWSNHSYNICPSGPILPDVTPVRPDAPFSLSPATIALANVWHRCPLPLPSALASLVVVITTKARTVGLVSLVVTMRPVAREPTSLDPQLETSLGRRHFPDVPDLQWDQLSIWYTWLQFDQQEFRGMFAVFFIVFSPGCVMI